MKKISVVVPCYNEELSINELYHRVKSIFEKKLCEYDFEIIFVDDFSKDNTRDIIRELCDKDNRVKAVFNIANFGFSRNVFSALQQAGGDAAFLVFGDLQDPPELLPDFVRKWELGTKVIIGQKRGSEEDRLMQFMRKGYYFLIKKLSDGKQIRQFNGFGLYDRKFIEILRQIEDIQPYLKAVVAEYSADYEIVEYIQSKSNRGKSNFNFYRNYDFAMEGITSSTKKLMRIATFSGAILGVVCAIYGLSVIIRKLIFWSTFPLGTASIMAGIFLLGAIQLFFIGVLGEYVLSINVKTMRKPRVIIDETINFEAEDNIDNDETDI